MDLVLVSNDAFTIALNQGNGQFLRDRTYATRSIPSGSGFIAADFDADNDLDIIQFDTAGAGISVNNCFLLGDVNRDGEVNLLDVTPFVDLLSNQQFQDEADINQDGSVNLLDVVVFIDLLDG